MLKGVFIDLVLIRISGGQLNDSSSIQREDIRSYMPAAINYVVSAAYNTDISVEGHRDYPSLFYGYFPAVAILTDTARHNWKYIVRPSGTIPMPKNQGIRAVEDGCGHTLKPLSDNNFRVIDWLLKTFPGEKYFRPEGKKIYLFGLPAPTNNIGVSLIVDCDSLADTDELPIQAGLEGKAIDICVEFITGERQMPADRKSDERDLN